MFLGSLARVLALSLAADGGYGMGYGLGYYGGYGRGYYGGYGRGYCAC